MRSRSHRRVCRIVALMCGGGLLAVVAGAGCDKEPGKPTLQVYCAAGIREPVAEVIEQFQEAHGVTVQTDYAGSNVLLTRLKTLRRGDIYMPGDRHYVQQADEEGLVASSADICYFVPVILVVKGNPKQIAELADLARPGLRSGLGNAEACAIGRTTAKLLEKNNVDPEEIKDNVVLTSITVNDLGLQIKAGKLDATIVWDAIARQYPDDGEIVAIPPESNLISTVPAAVLTTSEHPELAETFQEFITSDIGREAFVRHGYTTELPE
ncbi:MAG: molybdate ABC transporter substrate-binding protein [Armatimonadota bacterium]